MIPYGRQSISDRDVAAVLKVLRSDFITQGPVLDSFEQELAAKMGARHCVCLSSATAGLHVAYLSLGLGPGDLLLTSPITFLSTANAARMCGAHVDFVDIDPKTLLISVPCLERRLAEHRRAGRRVKVIAPVHFAGQPCDLSQIADLAEQYGARVVEDAAHALGASYQRKAIGACTHSALAVFSFHPVKIITSAEGGAVLTNDVDIAERMKELRSHGQTRDPEKLTKKAEGPWYYEQHELGFNYRMTELQAALGLSQLARLDEFIKRRSDLARRYDQLLATFPVTPLLRLPDRQSAWHLYVIQLSDSLVSHRREIFIALRERGIGAQVHYYPVHLQPYYRALGFKPGDFPNAEAAYRCMISIPLFPDLTQAEQDEVVGKLADALST